MTRTVPCSSAWETSGSYCAEATSESGRSAAITPTHTRKAERALRRCEGNTTAPIPDLGCYLTPKPPALGDHRSDALASREAASKRAVDGSSGSPAGGALGYFSAFFFGGASL